MAGAAAAIGTEMSAIRLYEELAGSKLRPPKGGLGTLCTYAVRKVPSDAGIASLEAKVPRRLRSRLRNRQTRLRLRADDSRSGDGAGSCRERDPDPQQRPGGRILEEVGVQHRVEHKRDERGRDRAADGVSARAADQAADRGDHQRDVDQLADQPLLGGDRDRDRVRRRQGRRDRLVMGAVLLDERARAPAPDRAVGEQRYAAADQAATAARGAVDALVEAERPRRDRDRRRAQQRPRRPRSRAPATASSAMRPAPRVPPAVRRGSSATASAPAQPTGSPAR